MASDIIHVMPTWEEHDSSISCWCEPYLSYKDPDNGAEVWTHRRNDN